ncbi:MAG: hypothetical protein ABIW82_12940 [Dokdonella sp.]
MATVPPVTQETPSHGARAGGAESRVDIPASPRWVARTFVIAALAYVAFAIIATIVVSPRVPFADAWRHYEHLLTVPFPGSVLAADNGHPEVFANLVRYASLHWLRGSEGMQIAIGLLLALATLGTLLQIVWRTRQVSLAGRAAAAFVLTLGVCWLGNARGLLHDYESLQIYSVLLCLAAALSLLLRAGKPAPASLLRVAAATAVCFIASFNFGSGIASFGALLVLLFVQRAPRSRFYVVVVGLVLAAVCYRLLDGSDGRLMLRAWTQADIALRWLAAPLIYLFWPFVDPGVAATLPYPLFHAGSIARVWTAVFGNVYLNVILQAAAGAALTTTIVFATLQARRRHESTNDIVRLGLALAWFALGVAVLVALVRTSYFIALPSQVYAPQYLPWSSLAWAGLLLALVAQSPSRARLVVVAAVGLFSLAAELAMTQVMRDKRNDAEETALAAVVGVWPEADGRSENDPRETRAAAHALQHAQVGPFAWPEAALIGQSVPTEATERAVSWLDIRRATADITSEAIRLKGAVKDASCSRLLVVAEGRVIGLLRHEQQDLWSGAAINAPLRTPLLVFDSCNVR